MLIIQYLSKFFYTQIVSISVFLLFKNTENQQI